MIFGVVNIRDIAVTLSVKMALFLTVLTIFSCKRLPNTNFSFTPEKNAEAGDTIWFINESRHAESFKWEFGDGGISNSDNPIYIYKEAGIFEVKLNAFNGSGKDHTSLPITIHEPTILSFIAFDSIGNQPIPNTAVWIYNNKTDRDSLYAPLLAGTTDENGDVEFRNLDPIVYHVWASKEELGGMWAYKGYTSSLNPNELNRFIIPCYWISTELVMQD